MTTTRLNKLSPAQTARLRERYLFPEEVAAALGITMEGLRKRIYRKRGHPPMCPRTKLFPIDLFDLWNRSEIRHAKSL